MIQYDIPEQNAIATISVNIDMTLPISKDLLKIAENKVKLYENQALLLNTKCHAIASQIRATANTFNNLTYEEKAKAEIKITKLCINLENSLVKIWQLNFLQADLTDRINKLKEQRKIFINNLI